MTPDAPEPFTVDAFPAAIPLATRTVEADAGPARLLVLPTSTRDVVSFRGSFLTAPDLATSDDVALGIVADVLDKGTRARDRHAFADALDGRGARLSFYSDSLRIGFAGRALREDLPDVLALAAEALREPLLDDAEIRKAADRTVAAVRRSRESTAQQASGAMARRLVGPEHPNYVPTPDDEESRVAALTPEAVRAAWRDHVGSDGLLIAVVGDADPGAVAAAVADRFGGWAAHGRTARFAPEATSAAPGREDVPIADRTSLDVRLAHAVRLRRDSPDFLAAYAAVYTLGGNFSSRLMQTVRDEQGLTYGIGASLGGVAVEHDGGFGVSVTLSSDALERGIVAVRAEVERFVAEGVPAEALADVQRTLAGLHVVALATTGGLAARLLVNAERGFDVDYLDAYPDMVRALTLDETTDALRRHVRPDDLHTVAAGTFPA
ncbi:MAG TPA: pitrilysin family protein [Rubricoccaceae bacterium]